MILNPQQIRNFKAWPKSQNSSLIFLHNYDPSFAVYINTRNITCKRLCVTSFAFPEGHTTVGSENINTCKEDQTNHHSQCKFSIVVLIDKITTLLKKKLKFIYKLSLKGVNTLSGLGRINCRSKKLRGLDQTLPQHLTNNEGMQALWICNVRKLYISDITVIFLCCCLT